MGAKEAKVKRVVYAASSSAYGDTPTLPKYEGMVPNPISPYAVQKLTGELYITSFYRVYGLEGVSLRYFNNFGPRQDTTSQYSGVLAKFHHTNAGEPALHDFGDGEQSHIERFGISPDSQFRRWAPANRGVVQSGGAGHGFGKKKLNR